MSEADADGGTRDKASMCVQEKVNLRPSDQVITCVSEAEPTSMYINGETGDQATTCVPEKDTGDETGDQVPTSVAV